MIIKFLSIVCPITDTYLWWDYLYICFFNQFPVFCMGIVAYWIMSKEILLRKYTIYNYIVTGMAIVFIGEVMLDRRNVWGVQYIYWLGLAFCIILCSGINIKFMPINNIFFRTIGKYSYGIYFSHYLIRKLTEFVSLQNPTIEFCVRFIICLFCSLVISIVITNCLEKKY